MRLLPNLILLSLFLPSFGLAQTTNMCEMQIPYLTMPTSMVSDKNCKDSDRVIKAIKIEIAKSICLEAGDAVCLRKLLKADKSFILCISKQKDLLKEAEKTGMGDSQSRDLISSCLTSEERVNNPNLNEVANLAYLFAAGSDKFLEGGFKALGEQDNTFTSQLEKSPTNSGLISQYGENAMGLLAVVPNPYVQGGQAVVSTFVNLYKNSDKSNGSDKNKVKECGFQAIHIPARIEETGLCVPNFSVANSSVRNLLLQKPEFHKKALACAPTCQFYQQLATMLWSRNDWLMGSDYYTKDTDWASAQCPPDIKSKRIKMTPGEGFAEYRNDLPPGSQIELESNLGDQGGGFKFKVLSMEKPQKELWSGDFTYTRTPLDLYDKSNPESANYKATSVLMHLEGGFARGRKSTAKKPGREKFLRDLAIRAATSELICDPQIRQLAKEHEAAEKAKPESVPSREGRQ